MTILVQVGRILSSESELDSQILKRNGGIRSSRLGEAQHAKLEKVTEAMQPRRKITCDNQGVFQFSCSTPKVDFCRVLFGWFAARIVHVQGGLFSVCVFDVLYCGLWSSVYASKFEGCRDRGLFCGIHRGHPAIEALRPWQELWRSGT